MIVLGNDTSIKLILLNCPLSVAEITITVLTWTSLKAVEAHDVPCLKLILTENFDSSLLVNRLSSIITPTPDFGTTT